MQVNNEKIDLEDLEQAAKENRPPRPAERYRIRVDKAHYDVAATSLTGRQILELTDKRPLELYNLYQRMSGNQRVQVGPDETVDFTEPGIERFVTLPKDQTEG